MSEVNATKFYQFLSKYQADGGWDKVADGDYGNEDGTVIKSEFRKFMNAEWNGEENGELTNDLINSFWKKIDTNTSASKIAGTKLKNLNALDKNETANLEKRLEVYVQFDEFLANKMTIPSALTSTGSQWKSDVTDELSAILEKFIADGCKGDLNTLLTEAYPSIANKCTAQYCAVEYQETLKSGILAEYPEYKVADDRTMQDLILAYTATIDAETDPETIKDEIISIMDAYLATAGLGEDSAYPLEDLGFDASKLNDIQIAVITQTIKNDLADETKNYEGYETEFNEAVKQFIEAKIKEGGTFEELKGAATEFANSKFKQQLDNTVTINTTYRDVKEDSDFYNRLVEEFGETLAKKIAQNDRYIQAYKDIINDIAAKVNAGEMTMDEVADYVIEQISANLEKFFANGLGDMSLEELNATYDKLAASADAQTDDEASLTQHREAAIKYCDALAKKSDKLKEAVIEAFGDSNYKSAINNMLPGEIQEIMEELKAKALEIGDPASWKIDSWTTSVPDSVNINPGNTASYSISASIKSGDNAISADRITYKTNNSIATIANGVLTIKTPANDATYTIEIYAYVDGQKVGEPKVVTVTCKSKNAEDMKNEGNILVDGQYMKDLISKHNHTTLLTGWKKWSEFKAAAKTTISNMITQLTADLISAGYNAAKVNYAAQTTLNYYNAAIDAMTDQQYNSNRNGSAKNMNFSYVDANGQSKTSSDQYWQSAASSGSDAHYGACANMGLDSTGLQIREEYSGTNTYCIYLNTGVMLNKFMQFMNI